ncbi:hypothetical protein ACUL41_16720 [Virgibacillus natechei]|uniref:hypothetical protein n=1 Tax=Virgibacillus sp. CBA3643 TaxID=2942278 RepID=UPI0035A3A70B
MMEVLKENNFFEKITEMDTPAIVYNLDYVRNVIDTIESDIFHHVKDTDRVKLFYSCKANSNPKIIHFLNKYIDGFDVASEFEYKKIKTICEKGNTISYTSPFIDKEILQEIYSDGNLFDFNSISQLMANAELISNKEIGLRINMDLREVNETILGNKSRFGVYYLDDRLEKIIKKNFLKIKKLHIHTGEKSASIMEDIINRTEKILANPLFEDVETVDVGGGLINLYKKRESIKEFWSIIDVFLEKHPKINIVVEPGSLIVALSGYLISSIAELDYTIDGRKANITLDTSRHNLFTWNKPNLIFPKKVDNEKGFECNINGCTCYELDFFMRSVHLDINSIYPQQKFIFGPVGAYVKSNSKSLHDYPFPKEYYFSEGSIERNEVDDEF